MPFLGRRGPHGKEACLNYGCCSKTITHPHHQNASLNRRCSTQTCTLRHSVPVHPGGGQGLAASHHHQADLIRNTGTSKRTKYPRPSSSRGLHDLLPKQSGIREKGSSTSQEVCSLISSDLWHRKRKGLVWQELVYNIFANLTLLYNYWSPGEGGRAPFSISATGTVSTR